MPSLTNETHQERPLSDDKADLEGVPRSLTINNSFVDLGLFIHIHAANRIASQANRQKYLEYPVIKQIPKLSTRYVILLTPKFSLFEVLTILNPLKPRKVKPTV